MATLPERKLSDYRDIVCNETEEASFELNGRTVTGSLVFAAFAEDLERRLMLSWERISDLEEALKSSEYARESLENIIAKSISRRSAK